jgi:glycogen synthase
VVIFLRCDYQIATKFRGILNGVDVSDWNPAVDPLLPANFNADLPTGAEWAWFS